VERWGVCGSQFAIRSSRFPVAGSRLPVYVRGSRFAIRGSRFAVRGSRFTVCRSRLRLLADCPLLALRFRAGQRHSAATDFRLKPEATDRASSSLAWRRSHVSACGGPRHGRRSRLRASRYGGQAHFPPSRHGGQADFPPPRFALRRASPPVRATAGKPAADWVMLTTPSDVPRGTQLGQTTKCHAF
jgi:hypothetical protein